MASIFAFKCKTCGEMHEGAPSFSFDAPSGYYDLPPAEKKDAKLNSDLCVIGEDRFIRVCLELPIHGFDAPFMWGVWVSLSEKNFERYVDTYEEPDTSDEYFGWFCNRLPFYPDTLLLKTMIHPRKGGNRPYLELEPTEHPLSQDFHRGLSIARAQQIAEHAMHEFERGKTK